MTPNALLLDNTGNYLNLIGQPVRADSWYGYSDGLHTVSFHVQNFTGRIFIQASLSENPTEDDWFDICLGDNVSYLQFPLRPNRPTGVVSGDTGVSAMSFKANILWLRAKVDRSYLTEERRFFVVGSRAYLEQPAPPPNSYGTVSRIVVGR